MAEETFETFVQRERDRLHTQREALVKKQDELENEIALVDRELAAVDAYEAAKSGTPVKSRRAVRTGRTRTPLVSHGRRGSKRDEIVKLIEESDGLSRGEILEQMGVKGNKAGEMSISNALTALTKSKRVSRRDHKYVAA